MKQTILYIVFCLLLFPALSPAQEACMHTAAGSITPVGVMGSHTHHKGSWMFSYQFMHMNMENNLTGRKAVLPESILDQYMMAPGSMDMQMHMLGSMYALTDRLTLMGMLPYLNNRMHMQDRMGMPSEMHSSNLGDISLTAMYSLIKGHSQSLQLNMGLSLPTGSIEERGSMQHMQHSIDMCLPYMMQTGSGTWDLMPALTYMTIQHSFSYGLQGSGRLRLGENERAYRLGHLATLNAWANYQQNSWLSYSLRLQGLRNWALSGQDGEMDPMMSPSSDAINSGSQAVTSFLGTSLSIPKGLLKGHRLALEFGVPLYQEVNGIQMQAKNTLIAGWQLAF